MNPLTGRDERPARVTPACVDRDLTVSVFFLWHSLRTRERFDPTAEERGDERQPRNRRSGDREEMRK